MKHHEDNEQKLLFEWASYYPALRYMFAIPNGAFLAGNKAARARQMARLKAQGLKPGVHDIYLPVPVTPYFGMFLELKRADGKGRISEKQADFGREMGCQGYKVAYCNGFKEAVAAIEDYLGDLLYGKK